MDFSEVKKAARRVTLQVFAEQGIAKRLKVTSEWHKSCRRTLTPVWRAKRATGGLAMERGMFLGIFAGKALSRLRGKLIFPALLFAGLTYVLVGCSTPSSSSPTLVPHLYMGGTIGNPDPSSPGYWKDDGTFTKIGAVAGSFSSGVTISGSDYYTVGGDQSVNPVYWKNGTPTALTMPSGKTLAYTNGIGVSGSNVYVNGVVNPGNLPVLWTNGAPTYLSLGGAATADNNGMVVSGGNVYVLGNTHTPNNPVYWDAAGALHVLPQGTGNSNGWTNGITGTPSSIAVSGSDVYIAGTTYDGSGNGLPIVWKNGTILWTGASSATSYAIVAMAVSGSDVYATGAVDNGPTNPSTPVYWKNGGTAIPLSVAGLVSTKVTAQQIAVSGNNIYIVGKPVFQNATDPLTPLLWVNGAAPTFLTWPNADPNAQVQGVEAEGNDIWIAATTGTTNGSGQINFSLAVHPVAWKNGSVTTLSMGGETQGGIGNMIVVLQ
jgi:hypothetical protein